MAEVAGEFAISSARFAQIQKTISSVLDFKKALDGSLSGPTTQVMEVVFGGALILSASDVHLEPLEDKTRLRVRIDGILQDVTEMDRQVYETLLSRIKLISGLKLNVSDRPQDGRFSINAGDLVVEIRTSTLPAEKGETAVLRILNPKNIIDMEALGLRNDMRQILEKEIKKPNGMIIVTGPTGSGKTTTLYAFLKKVKKPEIKIITIEDPIEYHLEGISQTQVHPKKGYDFATGLKSIVRQDPDIILVGEIRDLETANIALQAALTGHLVFTTLHTNDAAGTIARLTNLGSKPADIGPAVNLVVAQRLVRKICGKCGRLAKISASDLQKIKKELRGVKKISADLRVPKIQGCKHCNMTGYKGRVGIFEAFLINSEVERIIIKNPSIAELRDFAIKRGMTTIKQDGFIKVLEGLTTIEEVERVTGEG